MLKPWRISDQRLHRAISRRPPSPPHCRGARVRQGIFREAAGSKRTAYRHAAEHAFLTFAQEAEFRTATRAQLICRKSTQSRCLGKHTRAHSLALLTNCAWDGIIATEPPFCGDGIMLAMTLYHLD